MPLYSIAMHGGWSDAGNAFDLTHEAAHLGGSSHHHMDDGSLHFDDSEESAQHHADHTASCHAVALLSIGPSHFAPTVRTVNMTELHEYIPDHVPEQPQRPPQALG